MSGIPPDTKKQGNHVYNDVNSAVATIVARLRAEVRDYGKAYQGELPHTYKHTKPEGDLRPKVIQSNESIQALANLGQQFDHTRHGVDLGRDGPRFGTDSGMRDAVQEAVDKLPKAKVGKGALSGDQNKDGSDPNSLAFSCCKEKVLYHLDEFLNSGADGVEDRNLKRVNLENSLELMVINSVDEVAKRNINEHLKKGEVSAEEAVKDQFQPWCRNTEALLNEIKESTLMACEAVIQVKPVDYFIVTQPHVVSDKLGKAQVLLEKLDLSRAKLSDIPAILEAASHPYDVNSVRRAENRVPQARAANIPEEPEIRHEEPVIELTPAEQKLEAVLPDEAAPLRETPIVGEEIQVEDVPASLGQEKIGESSRVITQDLGEEPVIEASSLEESAELPTAEKNLDESLDVAPSEVDESPSLEAVLPDEAAPLRETLIVEEEIQEEDVQASLGQEKIGESPGVITQDLGEESGMDASSLEESAELTPVEETLVEVPKVEAAKLEAELPLEGDDRKIEKTDSLSVEENNSVESVAKVDAVERTLTLRDSWGADQAKPRHAPAVDEVALEASHGEGKKPKTREGFAASKTKAGAGSPAEKVEVATEKQTVKVEANPLRRSSPF